MKGCGACVCQEHGQMGGAPSYATNWTRGHAAVVRWRRIANPASPCWVHQLVRRPRPAHVAQCKLLSHAAAPGAAAPGGCPQCPLCRAGLSWAAGPGMTRSRQAAAGPSRRRGELGSPSAPAAIEPLVHVRHRCSSVRVALLARPGRWLRAPQAPRPTIPRPSQSANEGLSC